MKKYKRSGGSVRETPWQCAGSSLHVCMRVTTTNKKRLPSRSVPYWKAQYHTFLSIIHPYRESSFAAEVRSYHPRKPRLSRRREKEKERRPRVGLESFINSIHFLGVLSSGPQRGQRVAPRNTKSVSRLVRLASSSLCLCCTRAMHVHFHICWILSYVRAHAYTHPGARSRVR